MVRDGGLAAWGVIRPCRTGHKIGPLVAGDRTAAETVFTALVMAPAAAKSFSMSRASIAMRWRWRKAHGLAPVFETARMYTGPIRPLRLDRVFGVTTFELG